MAGWIAGIAAFAVVVSLDLEPFLRVELALVAAVVAARWWPAALLQHQYAAHAREA